MWKEFVTRTDLVSYPKLSQLSQLSQLPQLNGQLSYTVNCLNCQLSLKCSSFNLNIMILAKKKLFITDGEEQSLTGYCMYFLRANTKRTLGEETFQRDILAGLINATSTEILLWNIERTFSNIFIPFLNSRAMADRISEELFRKVKQELNPCLRSFAR